MIWQYKLTMYGQAGKVRYETLHANKSSLDIEIMAAKKVRPQYEKLVVTYLLENRQEEVR